MGALPQSGPLQGREGSDFLEAVSLFGELVGWVSECCNQSPQLPHEDDAKTPPISEKNSDISSKRNIRDTTQRKTTHH